MVEWLGLSAAERAERCSRVILVGSESTGKTTLAQQLVQEYRSRGGIWGQTLWVPEYGREYTEVLLERQGKIEADPDAVVHSAEWGAADFAAIALEQQRQEDAAAAAGSPVLFCDTDAFATQLWERRYLGPLSHAAKEAVPVLPRRALYLVADLVGVPFEQDGIRDGENYRQVMQQWFVEDLTADGQHWALVTGNEEERLGRSILLVDEVLAKAGY